MGNQVITVQNLRKSYNGKEVLAGIDFEVSRGEVFGFLGTNGAGKTTTIEILEGYRERNSGSVSVLGIDPAEPVRDWRERVGIVLQECRLDPLLTVFETVSMFANYYTISRPVDQVIDLVGIREKRDSRIGTLSGGQRRRVDVAIGIVGNPDLIFLDEPTTGFDPSARRRAWNMIEGLKELGKTIFLTTHYMDEAQHLADRVGILKQGKIALIGSPESLGKDTGNRTLIRFRLPGDTGKDEIQSVVGTHTEVSGNELTIQTEAPQKTLYKLLEWADSSEIVLAGLEVERPSLEDVFLDLAGSGSDE